MRKEATRVWTVALLLSLLVDCVHAQKLNVHWSPQSMMYLKGKHGRRFVPEEDSRGWKQGLHGWSTVLKGLQMLYSPLVNKAGHGSDSEKILVGSLQLR